MYGHVTILSHTPDPDVMISSGGRISTMDGTADEIYAKSLSAGREKNERLIGKVLSSGHLSVLEHCYVNLSFENVSVLAEQFLIEFRLASFTVKSRRYVDFSKAGYVMPAIQDEAQRQLFDKTVRALFDTYDALTAAGVPKEELLRLVSGEANALGTDGGDLDGGYVWAGQCAGLIGAVEPAGEVVRRMATEAAEGMRRLRGLLPG